MQDGDLLQLQGSPTLEDTLDLRAGSPDIFLKSGANYFLAIAAEFSVLSFSLRPKRKWRGITLPHSQTTLC